MRRYTLGMTRISEEERHAQRVENVRAWLSVIEESARELELEVLSRPSETASETGVDPDPRLRPCEHRTEWVWGRLCLACDNTGFRRATDQEKREGLAYDLYLLDPPRETYAVRRDESESARRARDAERLDTIIASLQRDARLRAGAEVREEALRGVRIVERLDRQLGRTGRKVLAALESFAPTVRRLVLERDEKALTLLAATIPGRIRAPL